MDPELKHFKTRAVGVLRVGPLQDRGYRNKSKLVTHNEIAFKDTKGSDGFMDTLRRKYASIKQLNGANDMRFVSKEDF